MEKLPATLSCTPRCTGLQGHVTGSVCLPAQQLTESRMLPYSRLAPRPAKPAARPTGLLGTRRSRSFLRASCFSLCTCRSMLPGKQVCALKLAHVQHVDEHLAA